MVFNTYIFMACFGLIANRSVSDGHCNVFSGILGNVKLILLFICAAGVQIVIVQYGNVFTSTVALTVEQHLICAGFAASTLIWGLIAKLLPISWFSKDGERSRSIESGSDDYVKA